MIQAVYENYTVSLFAYFLPNSQEFLLKWGFFCATLEFKVIVHGQEESENFPWNAIM